MVGVLAAPTAHAGTVLVIPRIGIHTELASSLALGPVEWWHDRDTTMIAGHDVTPVAGFGFECPRTRLGPHRCGPFWNLHLLRRGDLLRVGRRVYRVRWSKQMLPADANWARRWTGVVLSGCWPRYSATYRWVVLARPVGWKGR